MKKVVALFLLVTTIGFSQETVKSELGDFDEIKVFNALRVTIKKAETASIEITGDKATDVVYKNVNGRLKLSMRFPETFNSDEVDVVIYYTNDIHLIDANEGSFVGSKETLEQQNIELKVQEGAVIDLELDVKYLTIRSVTGGQITVEGKADSQDVEANTGGSYKGYDLKTNHTTIVSASGAFTQVRVSDLLDATVRFGGTIYYKGNPAEITSEKIIGGTIKSKD